MLLEKLSRWYLSTLKCCRHPETWVPRPIEGYITIRYGDAALDHSISPGLPKVVDRYLETAGVSVQSIPNKRRISSLHHKIIRVLIYPSQGCLTICGMHMCIIMSCGSLEPKALHLTDRRIVLRLL